MQNLIQNWILFYDKCEDKWHSIQASKLISNLVVLFFLVGIIVTLLSHYQIIDLRVGKFFAIELAFSILLISEILGLVFILTHSVADSVGKQFEIVSLILLRDAFKEMGHLPLDVKWNTDTLLELLPLLTDALGAVFVFLIIGLFYRSQRHVKITSSPQQQLRFIMLKKSVANVLLLVFISICVYDLMDFFFTNRYHNTFNVYYTILIFTDILILIISLRYSNLYIHLFRYSSFALATVILRLSLSAPKFYNVLLSVSAGLFVLLVTNVYNLLNKNEAVNKG
ncbi:MAG: hypothetical protein EAZ32_04775 [Cytophagia bacterium]|nr:MAG: hypothetical protein EAZ32_04775 [Cytophagia bacterium]